MFNDDLVRLLSMNDYRLDVGAGLTNVLNSLTAIDAHERQRFNELRGTVVSR